MPIAVCLLVAAILGVATALFLPPQYMAEARLLVEPGRAQFTQDPGSVVAANDEAAVLNAIEVIQSSRVLRAAAERLDLGAVAPDFEAPSWRAWLGLGAEPPEADPAAVVREWLLDHVSIERVGRSAAVSVIAWSDNPVWAAAVANAFVESYLKEEAASRREAVIAARTWLEADRNSLEADLAIAEAASRDFLAANVGLGGGSSRAVHLEWRDDLARRLNDAVEEVSQAHDAARRLRALLAAPTLDVSNLDGVQSPEIGSIRERYRAAQVRAQGSGGGEAASARAALAGLESKARAEIERLAREAEMHVGLAAQREADLRDALGAAQSALAEEARNAEQADALAKVVLDRKAAHDALLERIHQLRRQESFPLAGARTIKSAEPPQRPSEPNKKLVLAIFLVLGAVGGLTLAAWRELSDGKLRTGAQVRDVTGARFLGYLPRKPGSIGQPDALAAYAMEHPRWLGAETLDVAARAVKSEFASAAIRTVGVTSILPGDGRTALALALAHALVRSGVQTILVDGDSRDPWLTRFTQSLPETDRPFGETGPAFLSALAPDAPTPGLDDVFDMRRGFDVAIIDLPPLSRSAEFQDMAATVDRLVLTLDWGGTDVRAVLEAFAQHPGVLDRTIGVVLNRSDLRKLRQYLPAALRESLLDRK